MPAPDPSAPSSPHLQTSAGTLRLLLTGGSGFIGCRLAELALSRGHAVTVLSAANNAVERQRLERLARLGIRASLVPLEDGPALLTALRGHEAVIHLAAAQHEQAPESYFRRVNVEGTRRLLEAAASAGVRRFVHGSTIGVYGAARDAALDEDSPLAPDNPYGRTKADAECVARAFGDRLEVVITRISETYGPADRRLLKLFRAIDRGRYVTLGRGTNEHQLIYVDDLCSGLLAAVTQARAVGETFVLAGEERLTTNAMVESIAQALGHARSPAHAPLWPFALAARACEAACGPLGVKPPLTRRRLDFFRKSFRFSTDKAREQLGFHPAVPFAEGARRTAEWYRAEGLLRGRAEGPARGATSAAAAAPAESVDPAALAASRKRVAAHDAPPERSPGHG